MLDYSISGNKKHTPENQWQIWCQNGWWRRLQRWGRGDSVKRTEMLHCHWRSTNFDLGCRTRTDTSSYHLVECI